MKSKLPIETYIVSATFNGKTFSTTVKSGQTVTPYFNPKTNEITWKIEPQD